MPVASSELVVVADSLRLSSEVRLGRVRNPSALPAAVPTRGRSEAYSKHMNRGCQVGRYFALER